MRFLIIVLLCLSACQSGNKSNPNVDKKFRALKREGELGKRVSVRILKNYPRYENAQVQNYISSLGRSAVVRLGRQELYYYFAVLSSKEAKSFAAPGGFVFVTTGLIKKLKNEDQLIGVLSREIARINYKFDYKSTLKEKDISKAVEVIYTKLVSQKLSKKETHAMENEAIMGMITLNYSPEEYRPISLSPAYSSKVISNIKNRSKAAERERFKQLQARL